MIWWGNLVFLTIFPIIFAYNSIREQRGYLDSPSVKGNVNEAVYYRKIHLIIILNNNNIDKWYQYILFFSPLRNIPIEVVKFSFRHRLCTVCQFMKLISVFSSFILVCKTTEDDPLKIVMFISKYKLSH